MVLVDAPCSNTGVMAKRVQSRWRWPKLDHAALRELQLKLLRQAAESLVGGGILVYSTCSIDPAENEKLVAQFLGEGERRFEKVHEEGTLPSLTNDAAGTWDGGYFAVLRG
jgi:16S rRNA (cytosine967-C5)-methyltransferase